MSHPTEDDLELVRGALARDPDACRRLVARLSPILRQRVTRELLRHCKRLGRELRREDIDDLQHDVFLVLFDRDGRVLRAWDAERGLSLENFVGLVAQREAGAILRSGRRSAWAEKPTSSSDDAHPLGIEPRTPERQVAAREELSAMLVELRERLSPRSLSLFEALYAEHLPVEQVCARFEMTPNALYIFRNRLQALVAEIQARHDAGSKSAKKRVAT